MIIWDDIKNEKLKNGGGISFEEIAELIVRNEYLDVLVNPARSDQQIFVITLKDYIYSVPFIIDERANIILKTAYPSRKLNQIYGVTS
ncbi:MAG: hypothetical protein PF440_04660 [Thiomicrorhabdus sp.]|nr:hypothetical protein [Thiomicrorhabdus sp.]